MNLRVISSGPPDRATEVALADLFLEVMARRDREQFALASGVPAAVGDLADPARDEPGRGPDRQA